MISIDAWNVLYLILRPKLQRTESKSRVTEPIAVELIMGIGFRCLAGGRVANERCTLVMSYAQAYHSISEFILAILTSPQLTIALPQPPEQWQEVRQGFLNKSKHIFFVGCVGAVDVFKKETIAPSKKVQVISDHITLGITNHLV